MLHRLLQQYFLQQKQRNQVIQKKKTLLDTYNGHPQQQSNNPNWRIAKQVPTRRPQSKQGKYLLDGYGNPTKHAICHSFNHWAQNCLDRENENTFIVNEVVLHQGDIDNPNELKNLTSETWSSALLDCGASKTVCRKEWLTQYVNNLSDEDQQKVSFG